MQLTILGTSAMVPTKTRNHSGYFLSYDNEGLLFDCGEATQRQLKLAGIKLTKVTRIFISHWHGDHTLGLPGLIQSLASEEYTKTLNIYGPPGTQEKFDLITQMYPLENNLEIKVHEITKSGIIDNVKFQVKSYQLDHRIPSFGFSFIEKDRRRINMAFIKKMKIPEGPLLGKLQTGQSIKFEGKTITPDEATRIVKGKKVTYIADTRMCKNCMTLAKDSDLLLSESTYAESEKEKATQYFHMTASEAASIASNCDVKKLLLTHISQRYRDPDDLLNEAKEIFPNTLLAFDLMKIKI